MPYARDRDAGEPGRAGPPPSAGACYALSFCVGGRM
jgi:hypothetical protein